MVAERVKPPSGDMLSRHAVTCEHADASRHAAWSLTYRRETMAPGD